MVVSSFEYTYYGRLAPGCLDSLELKSFDKTFRAGPQSFVFRFMPLAVVFPFFAWIVFAETITSALSHPQRGKTAAKTVSNYLIRNQHLKNSTASASARRVAFKGADDTWEEASDGEKAPEETSERCRLRDRGPKFWTHVSVSPRSRLVANESFSGSRLPISWVGGTHILSHSLSQLEVEIVWFHALDWVVIARKVEAEVPAKGWTYFWEENLNLVLWCGNV